MQFIYDDVQRFYEAAKGLQIQADSRAIHRYAAAESIFVALPGKHTDGHEFVARLHIDGVRFFIVRYIPEPIDYEMYKISISNKFFSSGRTFKEAKELDGHFLVTENPLKALQELSTLHRQHFHYPVVGITGSNGKTIVKEWLAELLAEKFNIVKSPKSYNSQLGVPLSVWQMSEQHTLGIFEAGVSTRNEMKTLADIIRPDIGIFTNIGTAHDEGFSSRSEKIREKLQLFDNSKALIFNTSQQELCDEIAAWHQSHPNCRLLSWGESENSFIRIKNREKSDKKTTLDICFNPHEPTRLQLPFADSASLENALHYIVAMWHLTNDIHYIKRALSKTLISHLKPTMRLVRKKGINGCTLIDDSYSNDLAGLRVALEFLALHAVPNRPRTLILSDMLQSGLSSETICNEVLALVNRFNISRLALVGKEWTSLYNPEAVSVQPLHKIWTNLHVSESVLVQHFADTGALRSAINVFGFSFKEENILIKGARSFGFEQIVALLEEKIHGTCLEINLDAVGHNLGYYKSLLRPGVKIMAMVKAFSYGSGSHEIAQYLQQKGCDYLAVAYADEGVALRQQGITLPIMVMNPSPESFELLHRYQLEPEIYNPYMLSKWVSFNITMDTDSTPPPAHIKIDTGMHRLGFSIGEIDELLRYMIGYRKHLPVVGIFTHLAGADDAQFDDFSRKQLRLFEQALERIETYYQPTLMKYVLNSAGIVRFPEAQYDMVRLGIGLYGIESSGTQQAHLQSVATLKTTISQITYVEPPDTVGYGRAGVITKLSRIATLAIGYADGYRRSLGNGKGHFWIHGKKAPTVGRICMDMCMVDVTHIPEVREGDEAFVFYDTEALQNFANQLDTIPYEVLTGIGERVKRIYFSA